MGETEKDDKAKLLACARAKLARGDSKFSIAMLCAEAGVTRDVFRTHFNGKAALLAELVTPALEQAVATPDAWLERRLRVFERALNALEARVEAGARDQANMVAALEEKLAALDEREVVREAVHADPVMPVVVPDPEPPRETAPLLPLEPLPAPAISRTDIADVLQTARRKARAMPDEPAPRGNTGLGWLAIGALSLAALFLCAGLTLGDAARANATNLSGSGTTVRRLAGAGLPRTIALADAGDTRAQTALAVAYLRGTAGTEDFSAAMRWAMAAARDGHPVAQYVLGILYGQGMGVTADPARAFELFEAAAARGNLKAMHNLAIAYAEGTGTEKDETRAAQWFARAAARGYVDSAFDLGVLHERGMGMAQDLTQALKWYEIAALSGDAFARARADFLKSQMAQTEAQSAADQARAFTPLPALESANRLPAF